MEAVLALIPPAMLSFTVCHVTNQCVLTSVPCWQQGEGNKSEETATVMEIVEKGRGETAREEPTRKREQE